MVLNNKNLCNYCFNELTDNAVLCEFCGNSADSQKEATSNLLTGTILMGKFIIGNVLGKGGFGVTYLAYDLKRECKVAIKEYMPDNLSYRTPGNTSVSTYLGEKEDNFKLGSEKFYEEAKTISKFNGHPNIINVFEFFYENNTAYFVMEYIDGVDLKTYIARNGGTISEKECINILTPIMDALIVVHSVGILHRDISPDNIYVTKDGNVKLLDFGAARQVLGEKSKSLSVILKPGFAPIEQYQTHGRQGQWTDVYALAATMYFCLTGQVPEAAMDRVYEDEIKNVLVFNSNISEGLKSVLMKALEVRWENRYRAVFDFKNALIKEISTSIKTNTDFRQVGDYSNNKTVEKHDRAIKNQLNKWTFPSIIICVLFVCITVAVVFRIQNNSEKNHYNDSDKEITTLDENKVTKQSANSSGSIKNFQLDLNNSQSETTVTDSNKTKVWIYYSNVNDNFKLYKILSDGTQKQKVSDETVITNSFEDGYIYYRNKDDLVFRMSVNGTDIVQIGNDSIGYLSVLNGWIYYSNWSADRKLYKMRIDGTDKQQLGNVRAYDIRAYGDWIYYRNEDDDNKLYKMNLSGNQNKLVVNETVYGITINNGWIYYINEHDDNKIYKVNIDGSGSEKIFDGRAVMISSFGDYIYYNNSDNASIYKIKTDGNENQKISSDNGRFLLEIAD